MEKVFNTFLYYKNGSISEIGYICHLLNGSEESMQKFLQENLEKDCATAKKIRLPKSIPHEDFMAMCRLGTHMSILEKIFENENASNQPLVLITPVVNGKPYFDYQTDHQPFSYNSMPKELQSYPGNMPDYLFEYMEGKYFRVDKLINDDYFEAIRLLYKNNHYISATKLLLCCIDSLAFIEYGDGKEINIFKKWLNSYATLNNHNVDADELWELRNSYLHMTNLDSRAIIDGKVKRIIVYVGNVSEADHPRGTEDCKFLNFTRFIHTISDAISKWMQTYDEQPEKWVDFIKRYDMTVSDKRVGITKSIS